MKEGAFIKKILLLSVLILSCFLSSCGLQKRPHKINGFYLDTFCEITLYGEDKAFLEDAMDIVEKYDQLFDANKENSEIWKVNNSLGSQVDISEDTLELINATLKYKEISGGKYEPFIYGLSSLWKNEDVPNQKDISSALEEIKNYDISINDKTVSVSGGAKFDPGSSAKGFISGKITDFLESKGVKSGIINLGGNIQVLGNKQNEKYQIALQSPFENHPPYILFAENTSISTCGTYERFFEKDGKSYHHILDVKTGFPKENGLSSVVIIGNNPLEADILSTVCFLLGETEGKKLIEKTEGFEAIFIKSSEEITTTSGIEIKENKFYIK